MSLKQEGDGKSPAGVFPISAVFGFTPEDSVEGLKMPYLHVNDVLECVDDSQSRFYNQLVYRDAVDTVDWLSSEMMRGVGAPYYLGAVVDHNTNPVLPAAGSCIFLHIWDGEDQPTIGCTAMTPMQMQALAQWLDADKNPLLVQLTGSLYLELQVEWALPKL
jgi:L,D-peptidoglycan transpeptidase YkuD (ErfK/YbiS/YcfS/YnhG family)